ncbi:sigma-70 family RNA polymerase sigma factor [Actinomadura darangshiensis]|uniref:Sigma-70 family RNA polymerase sigma factor n=1 Tax=Actinomadura darangshiensis TaxID=705336 RepID=A0A4V2YUV6_9ACTN|nr:sigma-70 family RNA polymerase sigma factor [Actinomadura darangshiensis]TDD79187.1 sigma-70 family RNA polymerase sigma factor [Actinomadura darangshiensis]
MERGDDAIEPGAAETSDARLISQVRDGDVAAYGALYERHLPAARGLACHLAGRDAAEDAVQDAFTKVLAVLKRGGGPDDGFRPYLLTAVRRTVYDRQRAGRRVHHTDEIEAYDPGAPFADPAIEELERSMIARAFLSLPERWQTVLWHTEVEGGRPADVAPILGLTANSAAALAYRAREGLRQAYLQMHLDGLDAADECRPTMEKLGSYVRGALAKRDSGKVKRHLDGCKRCKGLYVELGDVNNVLRDVLGPLVLGSATTAYLASSKGGAFLWFRHLPKRQQQALGGGVAAAASAVALAVMLVSNDEPVQAPPAPPAVAEPAAPPAVKPPAPARPVAAKPEPIPPRPEPRPKSDPPRQAPPKEKPRKPRPKKPGPPVVERPGGFLVHIEFRVSPRHTSVRVRVRFGTPRHARHVRHRTHRGHARLKPGSRGHRD